MKSPLGRALVALAYRETVWLKRYIGEYLFMWLLPLFFAFAVIGLPASLSGMEVAINKFSNSMGLELTLYDVVSVIVALSSVINLTSGIVADITQTLYFEFRFQETVSTILVTVGVKRFLVATAIARSIFIAIYSTLYVPVTLTLLHGFSGLMLYFLLVPLMMLSAVCVGFLSTSLAVFMYYYAGVRRPWVVSGLLVPVLLSGSGVFIPAEITPWYLRLVAQLTPTPYTSEAIRLLAIARGFRAYQWFLVVITALFTAYSILVIFAAKVSDRRFRRGG